MTRYRVPVTPDLLEQVEDWPPIPGFRLISIDGPWPKHPAIMICTFEDDHAPARMAGLLVEPAVRNLNGKLALVGLSEIPYPGPLPAPKETM